jgi:succinate-semialdehyde dehydrogenase / glutarate-semialdehyde dehydrogenase
VAYRSVNPATGEVLKTFAEHTPEEVINALNSADRAFQIWSAGPVSERAKIIGRSAHLLLDKKEELARLAALEMGKRLVEGRGEVEISASILQYFADNAESFLAPKKLNSAMGDAPRVFAIGCSFEYPALELPLLSVGQICRTTPYVWERDAS